MNSQQPIEKRRRPARTVLLPLVPFFLAWSAFGPPAHARFQDAAQLGGRVPDHEFTPLVGHDGRTRLSELYGQPVILAGWKRHMSEGLHACWLARDLWAKFKEESLIVILQDRQQWSGDPPWVKDVDFWYRFFDTQVWITESLADSGNDVRIAREKSALDVRSFVLIGVDGRLLFEETIDLDDDAKKKDVKARLGQLLKEEFRRRKSGWGEDPAAKKARALAFGKGDLGGALKHLDQVREVDRDPEQDVVREEIDQRFESWVKTVSFYLEKGRYRRAEGELSALRRGVRGREPYASRLAELNAVLESDEGRAALKLDKKLEKILRPFAERDLGDVDLDLLRDVREFAQEYAESPPARYARELDPLLKRVISILRKIKIDEIDERLREG